MENSKTANEVTLDIRGQICPSTLLTTLKEINIIKTKLQNGEASLQILTDNRDATSTIPNAIKAMGYGTLVEKKEHHYIIQIFNEDL